MNKNDLKPASDFAKRYGVKAILYGQAGTGKTPMINSAPRPLLLAIEPGLRSMANSNVPTFLADTPKRIAEFFQWFFNSAESKNFDTLAVDSGSEMAEVVLKDLMPKISHGQKLYGEMAKQVDEWITDLYYLQQKHVILICKETRVESGKSLVNNNGVIAVEVQYQTKPYFPGNQLNVIVPHKYDEILHASHCNIPGVGNTVAIRTKGTPEVYARDRSGNLNELEPPNLAAIIQKCMS